MKIEKKLRWFDRGAAAFTQVFPDALAHLGPDPPPQYVCPQCPERDASGSRYRVQLFPRTAVQSGELTAEDVPPKSFGGRELVLTCKPCNNDAGGSQLAAHARRRENPIDALRGVAEKPSHVDLAAGGHKVSATLTAEPGMFTMELPPRTKHANDPREEKAFREALVSTAAERSSISINFRKDFYHPRRANVAWLRHAYLALFAVAGYYYIFQPGLGIVRKQIREPEADHIPVFLAELPGEHTWLERCIVDIQEPEALRSWGVQFGKYVALLPKDGDTEKGLPEVVWVVIA